MVQALRVNLVDDRRCFGVVEYEFGKINAAGAGWRNIHSEDREVLRGVSEIAAESIVCKDVTGKERQ